LEYLLSLVSKDDEKCLNTFLFGIEEKEKAEEVNKRSNLKLNCFFSSSLSLFWWKAPFFIDCSFQSKEIERFSIQFGFFLSLSYFSSDPHSCSFSFPYPHFLIPFHIHTHTCTLTHTFSHTHIHTHSLSHTIKEKGRMWKCGERSSFKP